MSSSILLLALEAQQHSGEEETCLLCEKAGAAGLFVEFSIIQPSSGEFQMFQQVNETQLNPSSLAKD